MRTDAREVRLGADRLTPDADQNDDHQIHVGQRITHHEYGRGTVVLFTECLLQVLWDIPFHPDSTRRLFDHDPSFAAQLLPLTAD
jgi:hypothetical protein